MGLRRAGARPRGGRRARTTRHGVRRVRGARVPGAAAGEIRDDAAPARLRGGKGGVVSFPRSPRLLKGGVVLVDATSGAIQRIVSLQYNPDSITRTLQAVSMGSESAN